MRRALPFGLVLPFVSVLSLASVLALVGCGGSEPSVDGGGIDATSPDAAGLDAASALDATGLDAAGPDARGPDSGLDCATIGCGPPTVCGETCGAPCGCCACADGEETTRGGAAYVCSGGCYAPRGSGGEGDPCTATPECGEGLSCCYPCGIPGCSNACEPSCAPGTPGCAGGCLLRP